MPSGLPASQYQIGARPSQGSVLTASGSRLEVGRVRIDMRPAPVAEVLVVPAPRQLDAGAAAESERLARHGRAVAEIGAVLVAALRRGRAPDLAVVAEAPALVRELRDVVREAVRPVEPGAGAVARSPAMTERMLASSGLPPAMARRRSGIWFHPVEDAETGLFAAEPLVCPGDEVRVAGR